MKTRKIIIAIGIYIVFPLFCMFIYDVFNGDRDGDKGAILEVQNIKVEESTPSKPIIFDGQKIKNLCIYTIRFINTKQSLIGAKNGMRNIFPDFLIFHCSDRIKNNRLQNNRRSS